MPAVATNQYTQETYSDMVAFLADAERLYTLGWSLVNFALMPGPSATSAQVIAMYRFQQVVKL